MSLNDRAAQPCLESHRANIANCKWLLQRHNLAQLSIFFQVEQSGDPPRQPWARGLLTAFLNALDGSKFNVETAMESLVI